MEGYTKRVDMLNRLMIEIEKLKEMEGEIWGEDRIIK